MNHYAGELFWVTGLSQTGKARMGKAITTRLRSRVSNVMFVNCDEFRDVLRYENELTPEELRENAWRMARFCQYLTSQGIHCVCTTTSLYSEVREWLRAEVVNYHEIFIDTLATQTKIVQVEVPEDPDLHIMASEIRDDFAELVNSVISLSKVLAPMFKLKIRKKKRYNFMRR